jgi:uncharacterized protein YdhG (YjbR/CyaY superfamily)
MSKPTTVEEYFKSLPDDAQKQLQALRTLLKEELGECEEVISYGIPSLKKHGEYVIYYSAWKKHMALYPFTEAMCKELKESADFVTSGKGTIQFPYDKPLPTKLIKQIISYRLKEVLGK